MSGAASLNDLKPAQPKHGCEVYSRLERDPEDAHQVLDPVIIPLIEALRHGVDFALQEDRQEEFGDDQENNRCLPLIGCNRDSYRKLLPRLADDPFSGDVGPNEGCANSPHWQCAGRKKAGLAQFSLTLPVSLHTSLFALF